MFGLKLGIIILLAGCCCCLIGSCGLPQAAPKPMPDNAADDRRQTIVNARETVNTAGQDADTGVSNQASSTQGKTKLPFQTKARRRSIRFPDDCTKFVPAGNENWDLQTACADALQAVLPDLPRGSACGYEQFLKENSFFDFLRFSTDYHSGAVRFYSLSANKYLVEIYCASGAYNVENVYLMYDESAIPARAAVLEFPSLAFEYDEDAEEAKSVEKMSARVIGGVGFDQKTRKLIVFVKARGIGDAGHYARYSFTNDEPKLEEFRARFKWGGRAYTTDEILKRPPQTWKKYYPE